MKRTYSLLLLFFVSSFLLSGDDAYLYGKRTIELRNEINVFYPREENSTGEILLFDFLENYYINLDIDFSILDYSKLEKGHSFSKGYSVFIDGDKDDLMVIAVPLNHKSTQDQNRNGSINIAIALQLLEIFAEYKPPVSIEFLFLGAERGSGPYYPIGTEYFLSNFSSRSPTMLLYLDMENQGDLITIKNSSGSDLSPMWLVERFTERFKEKNLIFSTESIQSLAYQSGFETPSNIIESYLSDEVPAILLESEFTNDQKLSDDQWANSFIESILSFVLDSEPGFNIEWDRHYYVSELGNYLITLGEKEGVLIIISLLSILLLVILLRSRNLHLNLKRFRKHLWTFPLLLFLTFLYLFLSTLIIEEISIIKDFPNLWQQYPMIFLLFKICSTLFLYSGFIYLVRGLSISRSHHFYTYSAFTSVIISMFTILIFNINFSYFFLWSLFIISLFMISRNEIIKWISIILSPLPLIVICYLIFKEPYVEICSFLLVSRVTGNIFLTIIIMPTLMLISSLHYFHHRFHRHRGGFRIVISLLFWGSMTFLVLYNLNTFSPFTVFNRQPVYVDEKIDLNQKSRSILLSSPAPIGNVELQLDKQKLLLNDVGRSAEVTAPLIEDLLKIEETYSTFLDRMSLKYIITAKGYPDFVNIKLRSEKPLIIFDSNYPFEVTADGKEINFFIGKNPHIPLDLDIILPRGSVPLIGISVVYSNFPYEFDLKGDLLTTEKKLTIENEIKWNH